MAKHRVGIIGVGGIAGAHHRALVKMPGVTIAGITDTDAEQLAKRSKEWNVPACESVEALLEGEVESVFICTPPLSHRELVEQVAQAGKNIYLEKPIALSLEDADAVIAAARAAGIILMVGYNLRYDPLRRAIVKQVRAGEVGDLVLVWEEHWMYRGTQDWLDFLERGPWRKSYEESGGRMSEFGTHIVNWQTAVAGPIKEVLGYACTITAPEVVDDFNLAHFKFEQGVGMLNLAITASTPPRWSFGAVGIRGTIYSDGQQLCLQPRDGNLTCLVEAPKCESRWEHFLRCIERGEQPLTDGADARATLAVVLAFYESARTGEPVKL